MKLKIGLVGMVFLTIFGIVFYIRYVDKEKLHGDISYVVNLGKEAKTKIEAASDKLDEYQQKFEKFSDHIEQLDKDYGHLLESEDANLSDDPMQAASELNNAAMLAANRKQYDKAETLMQQSIAKMDEAENAHPTDKAELYRNYASILEIQGKNEEARLALKSAEELTDSGAESASLWTGESGAKLLNFAP